MNEPDSIYDDPWTDGHRPHPACGAYVEEHQLAYRRNEADGTARSYWACPRADSPGVLG